MPDRGEILTIAKQVITSEISSLLSMSERLDNEFLKAIAIVQNNEGRVVMIGMGKSGIIGRKIAATLASTGTPAFFVHPGEAFHGDLGMIEPKDVALLISNSGETEEIIRIIPFLHWQKNKIIAMTGNLNSSLAKHADAVLDISVDREACNNNLAPTNSTTAALVMGDAFAISLSTLKDFQPEDFARFHPGGSLGKKLLTRVHEVMQTKNLPFCEPESNFREVVSTMNTGRLGLALVIDEDQLQGIITDGDLRRALNAHQNPTTLQAYEFMTKSPKTIDQNEMFATAEAQMLASRINSMVVLGEERKVVGILQIYNS
ncbi:KpsF/GutQ family sugar-phosphate isomerase [Methyloradius palustris]|uniref:Arabinose 5-phosphate isomerase n=1 Tax=Methyloradius palustris TaxID=2778876 RepID=A0A8D5G6N2_9PROT|nr:KpsF/GutQ family sugar-phosphate isomerase [Methyloradius palustris]BCM24246.1 putative arabinose 5-phosphate isomerase [Methyloradius palustris]